MGELEGSESRDLDTASMLGIDSAREGVHYAGPESSGSYFPVSGGLRGSGPVVGGGGQPLIGARIDSVEPSLCFQRAHDGHSLVIQF